MKGFLVVLCLILCLPLANAEENATLITYRDAIELGNLTTIKQVVNYGGLTDPINGMHFEEARTPLIVAVIEKQPKAARFFLTKGADPFIEDDLEKTAFDYAEEGKNKKIISLLKHEEKKALKSKR